MTIAYIRTHSSVQWNSICLTQTHAHNYVELRETRHNCLANEWDACGICDLSAALVHGTAAPRIGRTRNYTGPVHWMKKIWYHTYNNVQFIWYIFVTRYQWLSIGYYQYNLIVYILSVGFVFPIKKINETSIRGIQLKHIYFISYPCCSIPEQTSHKYESWRIYRILMVCVHQWYVG